MKNNFQSKAVPRGTRTIWRYLSALFILFTFAIGNVWGATFVEKWQNGKNESTKDLVANFTLGTNASISSSRIQIGNGNTGSFTWTIPTGYTITSIKFVMNSTDNKVGSFTATNGTVTNTDTKEWTYSPSTSNISSETFSVTASGGAVQISAVWVTFSDGVSDAVGNYESIYPVSAGSESPKVVTFESSIATSNVTSLTTEGSGVNNKCVQVANNQKVVITASKNIKYILFSWNKYAPSADSKWEANTGSYVKATYKWTPANSTTKSVTFTRKESNTAEISNIHIVYYPSCDAPTTAFSEGAYTVGESALALSSLISGNNSDGAITYVVKTDGGTGASIAAGSFTATAAGTATITATQAADATHNKCEKIIDFNVVVTASSCAATIPGDISKGALTVGEITLTADGSAESGDIWYWQDAADGTATNLGTGATKNVNTAGTYYIRSYNTAGDCWSAAKSIEVTAEELLEHYAITYNKGAYGTGEIAGGEKVEGVAFTLSSDRFTRAGYVQVGWALTNGGAKAYDLGGSYTTDAAQEFFPVWAETSTYVASFDSGEGCSASTPDGWTFANAGSYGASDATADFECKFGSTCPASGSAANASYIAFAKSASVYATYDLGVATTVSAVTGTFYVGSSSARTFTIDYLGADGTTVLHTITVNHPSGSNWGANNVNETAVVDNVRYIKVKGMASNQSWIVMSAFSVTYVDLVTKYNVTFAKNGGSGADMATLKYAENAVVTLPSCSFTPPDDHVFDGWAVTKNASGDPITVTDGKFTMPAEAVTATAQWATISDFDVKFFQGYGDPDVQIGETQVISTGNYATAPADPTREGYNFKGWSYDATEEHIVNVAEYAITTATNFTAIWKQVFIVTFDGAGSVNVESGSKVASPDSPTQAGKIFQGWYNGESKYDFSAAVTDNLALISKWADADANHYVYAYNDDFHFDGVVYKTPEGKVDEGSGTSNIAMTTPYTLFAGAEGITSIVMTDGIYDSKTGAIQAVTALMKVDNNATSKLTVTIKSGYTATLKIKASGYSATRTISVSDATPASGTTTGQAVTSGAMSVSGIGELSFAINSGSHDLTVTGGTLYIAELDIEATALPTHSVTYKPGDGEGAWVVDADATEVADCPGTFTAPTGKVFNGWKNESDDSDVAVGAIVEDDMNLIAQWINVYAVTFNMNGHGDDIDSQDVKEGAKAAKPADPSESGWIFGGWFTDNGTFEAPFDFNTLIIAATPLYAKWTEDPCPDPKSLSKVVLTATDNGTVSGYNSDEYAGDAVIGGLSSTATAEVDPSHEGAETGYKLNNGGSAIVFATLKKGTFQVGDRVVVTITKAQDAYKVEEVAQPILDIYYGTDKNDATFLTTIENVTAAGTYTYRLTAADVTAIGTKKGIGVFRPSSGRTQNPYVYSVEIQGCRSWAVTHNVTFDMKDHGTQVDPQVVPEGDHVAKPNVVEPEGWAFVGWYKETTLENEWNFATDVMGTEDITLYAKWESEAGVIKLFNNTGDLNTTNFVSAPKADEPITIETVDYPCLADFGSNRSSLAGTAQADVVQYNATTDAAKIKLDLYNNATGAKTAYLWKVEEGDESATPIAIEIPGKTRLITSYYAFNSTKNRSFYVTSGAKSDIKVLQVKVLDNGTAIPQFGKAGYSVNLNKGRIIAAANATIPFEGATIHSNDAYTVLNSSNLKPKTYIQFNNAVANTTVKITKASSNKYYVTNDLEHKGDEYSTDQEIVLTTTGPWYIGSVNSGSVAAFSKIEFVAPKCAEPSFAALANSDLCEGAAFEALDGTATVADAGVPTYQWYNADGDVEIDGATSATYIPTADGSYYVIATNHLSGYSDNAKQSATVTVTHFAAAVITTAPLNKRGEVDDVVTLTVAASGKNVAYKWYTCDEDGSNEEAIVPEQTGTSLDVTITAGMAQWYKVKVTSDCGGAEAKAKVTEFQPTAPANVTGSILWDWKSTAAGFPTTSGTKMEFTNTTDEELFADVDAAMPNNEYFRSDMLYGVGQYAWRNTNDSEWGFQGFQIKFHTTVAGLVRIYYRAPSSGNVCSVTIDAKSAGSRTNSWGWSEYVEVEANKDIVISMVNSAGADKMTRVQKIEFLEKIDSRTGYAANELGTACYEYDAVVIGATAYMIAGINESGYIVFDEIGELEAGKPYLFEADGGKIFFCKPIGVTAAPLANGDEITIKGMVGTFTGTTLTQGADDLCYFSGRHLWRVNDFTVGVPIPEHRCYVNYDVLKAEGPASAPAAGRRRISMGVNGENQAQGFENILGGDQPMKVMIDGTLYIIRGEKVFDATGRLVK